MIINVNVPITVAGHKNGFYPTGGSWPTLIKDREGQVSATITMKEISGGQTTRYGINLPRHEFSLSNPGSLINFLLGEFKVLPVEGICIRVPFQKSASGAYCLCTPEMLAASQSTQDVRLSFKAQSIVHLEMGIGGGALTNKNGVISPLKGKNKTFEIQYKGRRQHHAMTLPKTPSFFEKVYPTCEAGFYSMLTQMLDGPIKDGQTTLFPELRNYNLMASVIGLAKYWQAVAANSSRGKFNVGLGFTGSPLTPNFEDDTLLDIARSVRSWKKVVEEAPVQKTVVGIVVTSRTVIGPIKV